MRNGEVREVIDRRHILKTGDLANWLEKKNGLLGEQVSNPPQPPFTKGGREGISNFHGSRVTN